MQKSTRSSSSTTEIRPSLPLLWASPSFVSICLQSSNKPEDPRASSFDELTNMAPSIVTIDSSEPLGKILEIMERDGGAIVSNFLSPELLKDCLDARRCHITLHLIL